MKHDAATEGRAPVAYAFGPATVLTALDVPELPPVLGGPTLPTLHVNVCETMPTADVTLFSDRGGDGSLTIASTSAGYRIDFANFAAFHLAYDGGDPVQVQVDVLRHEQVDGPTLRHLLLDQVLPRALSLFGPPALHASAVAGDAGAALFVGPTGRGKSTLAATMALHGYRHLGDDAVLVRPRAEGVEAVPLVAGARLWPQDVERLLPPDTRSHPMAGYTPKARIPRDACPDLLSDLEVTRLRRIYLVREADDVRTRIKRIAPDAACVELVRNAFRVALDDPGALRRELELFSSPAFLQVVRELHRPQDHARLPEVRAAITADLRAAQRERGG